MMLWKMFRSVFILLMGLFLKKVEGRNSSIIPPRGQQRSTEKSQILNIPRPEGFIVGGFEIGIDEAPYQVSLQEFGSHTCGGAILSTRTILTAAHCTAGSIPFTLQIRAGSQNTDSDGELISVLRYIQHEKYSSSTVDYDFSCLILSRNMKLDATKKAVTLPSPSEVFADGTILTVSGWGTTQNGNESIAKKLRAVGVPIVNRDVCKDKYKSEGRNITDRMICAGYVDEGGKDSCQGDSAGPLVKKPDTLVGTVSWGKGCAERGFPGVYGNIVSVLSWINTNCFV